MLATARLLKLVARHCLRKPRQLAAFLHHPRAVIAGSPEINVARGRVTCADKIALGLPRVKRTA